MGGEGQTHPKKKWKLENPNPLDKSETEKKGILRADPTVPLLPKGKTNHPLVKCFLIKFHPAINFQFWWGRGIQINSIWM